ncbi:hypothetical protein W02_03470 [Nitrospira sp. KM1]|uniref:hypothetical protein n=1 Tax=Nitrospira sp. KM1 TaxID=1936990 RepID=UPI0013A7321D|nr:hypothetical protein [Nitrospira sp. KM1]BCA53207.1 hypothetical protein W02_03470 [Nitrospira sp. KM1]
MSDIHLSFCCTVCRKVKDEHWDGSAHLQWCSITDYAKRYVVHEKDILLSDSYCPDCSASYDRLVQYGRRAAESSL